jgi:predicted lipoprotein with Yx(FWY)xxD motif
VLPFALVAAVGAGTAIAASAARHASGGTVKTAKSAKYGTVLVAANGMTLYRYTPDSKGVSMCSGTCAKYWPPLLASGSAKPTAGAGADTVLLGTVKRGKVAQVTYAGFPVYFYAGDKKPGDVAGEGVQGTWYVVSAKGALVKHAVAATASKKKSTTGGGAAWG